jgi:tetratricopeptide (TPR) repeat protein
MGRIYRHDRCFRIAALLAMLAGCIGTATQTIAAPASGSMQTKQDTFETLDDFDYWFNLCRLQANAGEYEDALVACEQAIALEPEEPAVWVVRSGILLELQSFPDAIASADRALSFDGENSLAITYRCIAFASLNDNEMALDACNDALRVNGNWGDESPFLAWLNRGVILSQYEQHEQAMIAFERTLLLKPDQSQALTYLCRSQVELGLYEEAIASCQAALEGDQDWGTASPAIAWTEQGRAQSRLRNYDEAIAAYDLAISLDPNNALTWASQGIVLQILQRPTEALTSFTRATDIDPTYSLAQLGRCTNLNTLELYEEALAACDAAIQGDGRWGQNGLAEAWNQRSVALTGAGNYEEALASINRAVGIKPDYAEAHNHRGVIFWYLEDYDSALAANQVALELNPDYALAWFNRAVVFRTLMLYEDAVNAYERALEIAPYNKNIWANYSVALWYLQRYPEAVAAADRAIAIDPNFAQGWFNRATALTALSDYPAALDAYNQVLELTPENAEALTAKGLILAQLGQYEAALETLQASLAINPEQPLAQSNLEAITQLQEQQQNPSTGP